MPQPESPAHTNHLLHESSPYLLQHAHNPVDWYPWGEEALAKAKKENKPIFLSIGYSACHWCHVMERESFENDEIAKILNDNFVSIKVDREERPDLDDIYMQAVQMMTGSGGWPMSVFLTPDLRPFFGGTYFPPGDRGQMIGFRRLLMTLAEMYKREPEKIADTAKQMMDALHETEKEVGAEAGKQVGLPVLDQAAHELGRRFDPVYGGFGSAPKFPPSMALNLLLREHKRTGDAHLLEMAEKTLTKMALGGMYDQLGGGFARYSTDHLWLVPHFEKMLYDNALLAPVYFDAALVTGNKFYERIGREILDYVLRDMSDPAGGYYCAEDADSEGEEGKFYVWPLKEIQDTLGGEDAKLFCDFYGVTTQGNFEGENILNVVTPLEEFARRANADAGAIQKRLDAARAQLFALREKRVHPFKDTKILTAWNGMMITAMARGAQVTGDSRYLASAQGAAKFILGSLRTEDGRLLRTWGKGKAKIPGFIDDYAMFIGGLIDLYETDFNPDWLENAERLAQLMMDHFYDKNAAAFFTTDGQDSSVLLRRKDVYDGATPAGNSAAVLALLRLAVFLDRSDFRAFAGATFSAMHQYLTRMPGAVHHLLCALSFTLESPKEIAIIADPTKEETGAILRALRGRYLPNRAIALAPAADTAKGFNAKIALLKEKTETDGKPTIYVCKNYTCARPVHTVEELADLLT
ncbi:thioredoxin domain-containing protein [Candidatus Sumerlaeota bacterium]|nr:thioredoxin domain-containing protein [Candidatus Sumerlaeota bacterium]